jgi:MFS family permease
MVWPQRIPRWTDGVIFYGKQIFDEGKIMNKPARWHDYLTINIYWLGLTTVAQTMTPLVVPLLVQQFVGEELKGTFYGTLRLWTLMAALLVQALMGMLSDRSTLRWGRRRPFILIGTLLDLVFMALISLSAGLSGMSGYVFLFAMIILLQISSNTAQAGQNGLIPDLVPEKMRGRFSGVKAIFEIPLPLILVSFTIGRVIAAGHLWTGIFIAMGILVIAMVLTMFAPEERPSGSPPALNWTPFLRLALMTALFTAIILLMGWLVQAISRLVNGVGGSLSGAILIGVTGLGAMLVAIGLGVWMSVRVGVGDVIRKHPSFTWWVVNRLAFLVGANNLASFTVYFLQARLGFAREKAVGPAAMLTMFVGIFILLAALPSGWLADRFGHKRLVLLSGLVAALGTLIALLVPNLTLIYVGGSVIGMAIGVFYTSNWALGTEIVPPEQAGRYLGISNLAGAGAGAIGAYIGGPIADQITSRVVDFPGLGYLILFAIYGTLFLLSTLALRGIRLKPVDSKVEPQVKPASALSH